MSDILISPDQYIGHPISNMTVEVAKLTEIPVGRMKSVKAFNEDILLSNVDGKIYATSNRCGHQNAPLARGTLQGNIVTCPLHAAKFDVTSGLNLSGPQLMMSQDLMQKLPPEIVTMFKRTGEILSEIEVKPLKTYEVRIEGDSVFLENR